MSSEITNFRRSQATKIAMPQCAWLVQYYAELHATQPIEPAWESGLRASEAWLKLLQSPEPSIEKINALVRFAMPRTRNFGSAWTGFCIQLSYWAEAFDADQAELLCSLPKGPFPELDTLTVDWLRKQQ